MLVAYYENPPFAHPNTAKKVEGLESDILSLAENTLNVTYNCINLKVLTKSLNMTVLDFKDMLAMIFGGVIAKPYGNLIYSRSYDVIIKHICKIRKLY